MNRKNLKGIATVFCLYANFMQTVSAEDARVRTLIYDPAQVVRITVAKGVATHVVLAQDERIKSMVPGFGSDCDKAEHDWCIRGLLNDNEFFVKPKGNATLPNNLALTTNKRVYSFEFIVLQKNDYQPPTFRVEFKYPQEEIKIIAAEKAQRQALAIKVNRDDQVAARLEHQGLPKNWEYSVDAKQKKLDFAPTVVFDDGRFTHFKFPANREIPTIYAIGTDGSESSVAKHMEGEQTEWVVVHRLARQFVLRSGKLAMRVWNQAYDLDGMVVSDGITVDGISRVLKK